jgi:hypothetical protein
LKKKILLITILVIFGIFLALEACGIYLSGRGNVAYKTESVTSLKNLHSRKANLKKRISSLSPKGTYLVIDTAKNRLYVKKGADLEGSCSLYCEAAASL